MHTMATAETPSTPAYLPFKTLTNTLDALADTMPNRIDPSAFPGQSGTTKNQILLAFRFFGFITEDGRPTPALLAVAVRDEAARKVAFRKLFDDKYAPLIALNLVKTTPAEFGEKMTEAYDITGDTRLKATRFFLNAAEYLGVEVSPLLLRDKTKSIGTPSSTRKRRTRRVDDEEPEQDDQEDSTPAVESRSVELRSGGTLTLSATTKFMALSTADRKFVFDLIDKLEEDEAQQV